MGNDNQTMLRLHALLSTLLIATAFASSDDHEDAVVTKIRALAAQNKWVIGGDPCVEDEADETAYTFRMSVPSGSLLNHIEPTFKHLCFENGWDLIDDEVSFSKPRKGKTKFTMTIAVPKYHLQVQPATEEEVHQIVVQGFKYTESEMVIEFEGDRRIAGKKWLECENGIPPFVFEWTDYDSEHQQKAIRAWFGWNREHRTLQRRVENTDGTVHYWVITKWVCERAWVIERWTEARFREGVRRVDRVVYIRRGLHEPREGDMWHNCGDDHRFGRVPQGYDYHKSTRVRDLKVLDFPTNEAAVHGSAHKELDSRAALVRKGGAKVSLRHREVSGTIVSQRSQRGGGFDQAPGVYYGARHPCGRRSQSAQRLLPSSNQVLTSQPGRFRDQRGFGGSSRDSRWNRY